MKKKLAVLILMAVALGAMAGNRVDKLRKHLMDPNDKYVIVVAHRGDWRGAPENSLLAFQNCIDMGVDMIEIDVQMTKDSALIIMHDEWVDRTTDKKGRIRDYTLAEIRAMKLKTMHAATATRHQVPTLEEVLNLCKGKILINIDKGYDYFPQVLALLQKTGTVDQVVIKSGVAAEQVMKNNRSAVENSIYMPIVGIAEKNAEQLLQANIDLIHPVAIECCFPTFGDHERQMLDLLRQNNCKIWINSLWASLNAGHDDELAVDEKNPDEAWGWILKQGATLIQTDRPAELIRYLKKHHRR